MYLYISQDTLIYAKDANEYYYPGDVFIEILKENPRKNSANKAMIYCVGPEGNTIVKNMRSIDSNISNKIIEEVFLNYVNIVGKNIASAINLYNITRKKHKKYEKIDYVRICLISGFAYLPKFMKSEGILSREKVAEKIISGIHEINKISTTIDNIVYEFAWADKAFQDAFEDIKKKKSGELADFQNYVIN
jgi:hypothetical protein